MPKPLLYVIVCLIVLAMIPPAIIARARAKNSPMPRVHLVQDMDNMGRFKAPSLRNIAMTAPYMHDGSAATLDDVIDHYARGGREIADGPYAGDGRHNPYKSTFVKGFDISESEREDLIAFLESLTDQRVLSDERWSNPW